MGPDRTQGWEMYEAWRRGERPVEVSLDQTLAWLSQALEVARAHGPIPEPSLEEKARRIRRLHEALRAIRT